MPKNPELSRRYEEFIGQKFMKDSELSTIASVKSVGDFNQYYHVNKFNMVKLWANSWGAEGWGVGEPFLDFGFMRTGDEMPKDKCPEFGVHIPKNVFLESGFEDGDYLENLRGFLELNPNATKIFISPVYYRRFSKREDRELEDIYDVTSEQARADVHESREAFQRLLPEFRVKYPGMHIEMRSDGSVRDSDKNLRALYRRAGGPIRFGRIFYVPKL